MQDREGTIGAITAKLLQAGAVEECEFHGYPLDKDDDEAIAKVKSDLAADIGHEKASDLVDEAMSQVYQECPGCIQNAKDD